MHFVEMSSDDEEEQGEEGDEAEQEEEEEKEERSSGNEASDGGEAAATTVKVRRVTGTEPAAKKLKLRRSNRKRGSKPVGLQNGDAVEGKYGPLCVVAGGVRRSRSTLRGYIVAEAGGGKKTACTFGGRESIPAVRTRASSSPPLAASHPPS